jgi:hypothetical protein
MAQSAISRNLMPHTRRQVLGAHVGFVACRHRKSVETLFAHLNVNAPNYMAQNPVAAEPAAAAASHTAARDESPLPAQSPIRWHQAPATPQPAAASPPPVPYRTDTNYTTLGYGDVTPVERWRLLGPMTAMNGVLLFGWSTAVIFDVLRRTVRLGAAAASAVE